jgi:fructosamine-3-kinase
VSEGRALPAAVARQVAAALDVATETIRSSAVAGGSINPAARVQSGDRIAFVKWATPDTPADQFAQEAESLRRIGAVQAVRVPRVLAVSEDALVLEWIEPGRVAEHAWDALGRGLARLHRTTAARFGGPHDNYIGPLPQPNGWLTDWAEFFRERRIRPQLERALAAHAFDAGQRRALEAFVDSLEGILRGAAAGGASLLHGDLWSGNAHPAADDQVALIDPSSYYGDREVDLAMAELFGGFPRAFYEAYEEEWPTPGGRERRRSAYRVYYLLVHVNLFGAAYVGGTMEAVHASMKG